jgi:hemerythrin-like domain-containing protein
MAEHRLIEEALAALEAFVRRLTAGPEVRLRLREFAAFFMNFADRRHHGKEEDRLFRSLARHGFPLDGGPLAVMLAEHEEGRGHVRALARIAAGDGPLGPEERDEVEREARRFAVLLRNHIQKEDRILYPMALRVLPAEELDDLARQFAELEDSASPGVGLEGFRSAARALAEAHPPGAAR